jgi:uncharacterized protein with PIN domain
MDLKNIKKSNKIKNDYEDESIIFFKEKNNKILLKNEEFNLCQICNSNLNFKNIDVIKDGTH